MNKIILVGRLTKDPDLRYTPGDGKAVTKFTLAVNRPRLDKNKHQEADFINCTCFGKRAEAIANYVQKGHKFGIEGSLRINKYTDKNGNDKWSTEVLVSDFEFMQDKTSNTNSNSNTNNSTNDYSEDVTVINDGEIPF
ncbi:single-stranded DNA-binding protein [Clostridium botulinum]|uniref:single-stranded DNA-binding protein n=1 Tax=Clostridium novyi TaxID=1542 RepID=UPI0004D83802|nr:single-stranded DNA-binding protein [Clostridium novyi]KEI08046.1 single-strand binding protein [Clostridium novyi B str. NCTC 9691]KEI12773.1 single-stranded DNA-binding protein [Clostridium novyi B str. NCTC 9691]NFV47552.1 single-stranded DNA-binding protein [Clostridium botulinum]